MKHVVQMVAVTAVLTALVLYVPMQAQAPEIDALRERAERGNASAQNNLGDLHDFGLGVPEDDAEAVRWYRLAAEQGYASAQIDLGDMHERGHGVPQDYVQAPLWFNLAASRSASEVRENAVEMRDLVADRMPPEDLSEAQRLAREWDAAHPR